MRDRQTSRAQPATEKLATVKHGESDVERVVLEEIKRDNHTAVPQRAVVSLVRVLLLTGPETSADVGGDATPLATLRTSRDD